jgi:hypothetical protein
MDAQAFTMWFVWPLVLIAEGLVIAYAWRPGAARDAGVGGIQRTLKALYQNPTGIAVLVALWLVLTAIAWWYEFFVAFFAVHMVLFAAGRIVAGLAIVLFGALFLATPVLCGWAILHIARNRPGLAARVPAVRA